MMYKLYRNGEYIGKICRECTDSTMGRIVPIFEEEYDAAGVLIKIDKLIGWDVSSECSELLLITGFRGLCELHNDEEED